MALLRPPLSRAFRRSNALYNRLPSISMRSTGSLSDPEKDAQKTGYLEQIRRELVPEVFQFQQHKTRQHSAVKGSTKLLDNRDRDFKRSLVREATVVIREQVISGYSSGGVRGQPYPPQLVVLDGVKGVGKTSILEQTVAFARSKGYIVLYIPRAEDWTRGNGFFAATPVEERDPVLEGIEAVRFYDRPRQMHDVFKALYEQHQDDLKQIKCRKEFESDVSKGCTTLFDLVNLGKELLDDLDSNWRQNPNLAGEILHRLVKELCACDTKPVAIVIDNYEHFIGPTCMINERQQRVHANAIRFIADHFGRDNIEKTAADMKNGFVLLATDDSHSFEDWRSSRMRSGADYPLDEATRRDPSGKKWMSAFKSRTGDKDSSRRMLVNVPEFSSSELKTLCSTFVPGGLRRMVGGEQRGVEVDRLISLAGGRADVMQKIAVSR